MSPLVLADYVFAYQCMHIYDSHSKLIIVQGHYILSPKGLLINEGVSTVAVYRAVAAVYDYRLQYRYSLPLCTQPQDSSKVW